MIGSIDLVRWRIATYELSMKSLLDVPNELWRSVRAVGFDIDDTVTTDGRVTAEAYSAMWALKEAGFRVLAVTGRPAGWCDMIARTLLSTASLVRTVLFSGGSDRHGMTSGRRPQGTRGAGRAVASALP